MTTIRIQLNRDALEALQRPVVGRGGFQSLLQQLQAQVQPSGDLELSPELVARLARYAQRYGEAGSKAGWIEYSTNSLRWPAL